MWRWWNRVGVCCLPSCCLDATLCTSCRRNWRNPERLLPNSRPRRQDSGESPNLLRHKHCWAYIIYYIIDSGESPNLLLHHKHRWAYIIYYIIDSGESPNLLLHHKHCWAYIIYYIIYYIILSNVKYKFMKIVTRRLTTFINCHRILSFFGLYFYIILSVTRWVSVLRDTHLV